MGRSASDSSKCGVAGEVCRPGRTLTGHSTCRIAVKPSRAHGGQAATSERERGTGERRATWGRHLPDPGCDQVNRL